MFKINGQRFGVGIESMQRSITKDYKYQVTTEDGVKRSEIRALYRSYTVSIGNMSASEYDRLQAAISTYAESYSVTLPDGQTDITFNAHIDDVSDALEFIDSAGTRFFDGLTLTFTDINPIGAV